MPDEPRAAGARALHEGCTSVFDETDASLAEINPLIVTGDGKVVALDAKINFDANALFRHPGHRRAARPRRGGPGRDRGLEVRPLVHLARRQHRLPGERRGPRDGDDGHDQALRRRAGELPRRGRRRDGREGHRGLQDHAEEPEGEGDPRQHLRRHHEVRRDRRRAWSTAAKQVALKVPLVVRLEGTNVELGKKILADSGLPIISANDMARRGAEGRRRREGQTVDACRSSSTRTPRSSPRASPARPASSTRACAATTPTARTASSPA